MVVVLLMGCSLACAYDYGFDPAKVQYHGYQDEGYYMELAQDPVAVVIDGTAGWEYVIDMYDNHYIVSGSTYEIRGFENDNLLNVETDVTVPDQGTFDRIIMQFWGEDKSSDYFLPPSVETNSDGIWELTAYDWAIDNPWHVPNEYPLGGLPCFHTDSLVDAGDLYYGSAAPTDLIPIRNFSIIAKGYLGLVYTVRIVSTDLHEFDDITWTPWNDMNHEYPVMGNWIPEPTTSTLLAVGALALLRRRSTRDRSGKK